MIRQKGRNVAVTITGRWFDFDHPCPHISQQTGAKGAGKCPGAVDNGEVFKRSFAFAFHLSAFRDKEFPVERLDARRSRLRWTVAVIARYRGWHSRRLLLHLSSLPRHRRHHAGASRTRILVRRCVVRRCPRRLCCATWRDRHNLGSWSISRIHVLTLTEVRHGQHAQHLGRFYV